MQSILFISLMNGAAWGGSEEIWYQAAAFASRRGVRTACAVYHWPAKEARMNELKKAGCEIIYLPNKGRTKRNIPEKIQYKYTKKIALPNVINSLPARDYDFVVVNQGYFEVTMPVWKNFINKLGRFALVFHNYSENETFSTEKSVILQQWMDRAVINLYDSSRIHQVLEKKLNRPFPNSEVIYNPNTFPPPDEITAYPPLTDGRYLWVMLAALDTGRKAQNCLIKSLSSLKWKERNWILKLYGDGEDREMLAALIRENGLSEKVFLEGHSSNVRQVLNDAHLVLQMTHIDSMPVSVVEAMSMSRPVVASCIGDMPLWIKEGINGWISPDASVEQIDITLEKAWQQRESWGEMGKHSFNTFKEKYPPVPEEYFLKLIGCNIS